jgi:hypothetical protein
MPAKYVRPYSKGQKNDFRDAAKYLKRRVIDYFHQNIHVTTSGYYAAP